MRYDWFKQCSIDQFELVLRFSQISIRIRISFVNWFLYSYVLYINDTHEFCFVPQSFFRIFFFFRIRISLCNLLEKVILYMLEVSTKFGVAPQSFCENPNFSQNQDQDQDHDIILDFNTRPTFHTSKTLTKFCLDPLTPSKVIVSTWKVHVRTARQPDRQTDGKFFCLFCLLRHTKYEHSSKGESFFSLMQLQYFLFLHTSYMWWESKNRFLWSQARLDD